MLSETETPGRIHKVTATELACYDCGTWLNRVDSLHIRFKQVLGKDDKVGEQPGLYHANSSLPEGG